MRLLGKAIDRMAATLRRTEPPRPPLASGRRHCLRHQQPARRPPAAQVLSVGTSALALLAAVLQVGCSLDPGPAIARAGAADESLPLSAALAAPPGFLAAVRRADFGSVQPSEAARNIADWVVDSRDHAGRPFALIDKRAARLYVFDARGRLQGDAPVLLGLARGDESVPGIGERPLADIRPEERTTPAGRFVAEAGRNLDGEDIVWVDYDAAVSMHRVRATKPAERRLERLASATPLDNRISYGCINLPTAFYESVLRPALADAQGIVYVLPETGSAQALFGAYDVEARAQHFTGGVTGRTGAGHSPPRRRARTLAAGAP